MIDILLKNVFSPFYFAIFTGISFILYALHLTKTIEIPNLFTIFYVFLSLILFILGIIFAIKIKLRIKKNPTLIKKSKLVILTIWFFYFISLFLYIYEHFHFYKIYGSVPILNPAFEVLRFKFPINGYIHLLAMMNYLFLYILIVDYYYYRPTYTKIYKYILLIFTFISIILGILIGSRGIILNFLAIVYIALNLRKKISWVKTILIGILTLYVFGLAKLLRDYFFYGDYLFVSIKEDWISSNILTYPLYFSYLGISMNFKILNDYILKLENHFWGYFSIILPFYSLFPEHQYDLKDLQRDILGIDFHGTLTATIFSVPYIDFNILGALYLFLIGFVLTFFYKKIFTSVYKIKYILVYSYIYWMTMLGIYTYMFDKFYVLFNILTLIIISILIERGKA